MSSTTVCHQELQPCVESLVRLQLVPPKPTVDPPVPEPQEIGNTSDKASWSFLQSFTTTIESPKTETVYVHPLVKRSASVLSPRSLAMCTESLGSETGSDVSSDDMSFMLQNNDIPLLSLEVEKTSTFSAAKQSSTVETPKPKRLNRSVNGGSNFPPPLTSISGSNGVQFLPHREGGRLVLKAVPVTSPVNYFEAERGDGRLRLRLLRDMPLDSDMDEEVEEEEDEVVKEEEVVEEIMEVETETCWEEEEEEMEVEVEVEEKSGGCWETEEEEDMEGNSGVVVGETGMEKKLPSRCKENRRGNNKMVMNWPPESFWVAT